jgi:hypothetical protein
VIWLWLWLSATPCERPLRARAIAWLAGAQQVRVCLRDGAAAGIDPSGTAHLPADANLFASAARLAHLAEHLRDGALDPPIPDCDAWLAAQARRETAALARETALLDTFGVPPLPRDDRAVLAGYRARCER